jgi:predicted nucleic acid-binding protein
MSGYLLDTCILSEMNKPTPNSGVINWFASNKKASLYISVLTIGEIQKGIDKLDKSIKKIKLQQWLDNHIVPQFDNKILDIDLKTIKNWGSLTAESEKSGITLPAIDSLIVATAIANDLIVITRNIKDMQNNQIKIINPYE